MGMVIPQVRTGAFKPKSYDGDYMKLGQLGQNIVFDWLREHPEVVAVHDATELKLLQIADADALLCLRDGETPLAEIKTDSWLGRTPNVLVEVLRINHIALPEHAVNLGWTGRTVARWIMYVAISTGYVYQFSTARLRQRFQNYTGRMRQNTQFAFIPTDKTKSTIAVLMPLKECGGAYRVHDVLPYAKRYIPNIEQDRLRFAPESLRI